MRSRDGRVYYETLDLELARRPQTILASIELVDDYRQLGDGQGATTLDDDDANASARIALLCGLSPMTASVERELTAAGVAAAAIRVEAYDV